MKSLYNIIEGILDVNAEDLEKNVQVQKKLDMLDKYAYIENDIEFFNKFTKYIAKKPIKWIKSVYDIEIGKWYLLTDFSKTYRNRIFHIIYRKNAKDYFVYLSSSAIKLLDEKTPCSIKAVSFLTENKHKEFHEIDPKYVNIFMEKMKRIYNE